MFLKSRPLEGEKMYSLSAKLRLLHYDMKGSSTRTVSKPHFPIRISKYFLERKIRTALFRSTSYKSASLYASQLRAFKSLEACCVFSQLDKHD